MLDGVALPPRQRSIVAALVLHRGHGAPTDLLVDAVWGADVPHSARQSLQNQVARLRRRFGDDVITTDPAGYHLDRRCDVDAVIGLVAPWIGVPASPAAVAPLERGLALCRGPAYLDLPDHASAVTEAARLSELIASGAEQLAASRMEAGDLQAAVTELSQLVEDEPYRERRWELLILALHLAGRRAEALLAWERLAAVLAKDLGCRPSPDIVHLLEVVQHGGRCTRWRRQVRHRTSCSGTYRHT